MSRSTSNCSFTASATATCPTCGGSKAPPKRAMLRTLAPLEHFVAELDLVAFAHACALQDLLELLGRGRPPGDAEPALRAEHAKRTTRRLRAVDEVVDELELVRRRGGNDNLGGHELE